MASKKFVSSLVIAGVVAASASSAAWAGDHRQRDRGNGNGAAIAVGIIGAIVIGSLIANSQSEPAPQQHVQPQPYPNYEAQPQVYYPPQQPVQRVYYEQQPAGYANGGYREHRRYRHYYRQDQRDHNGYYSR
jgi:hypothetical protein